MSLKTGKTSRLSHYRLCDNYVRFYLKYIDKNKEKIERGAFYDRSLSSLPGWESIMGLQFENMVLNNKPLIWHKLSLYPSDIITDNPFFQRATQRAAGCQIDYLIQTTTNTLYACEIKFSKQPLSTSVINEMKEKLHRLSLPRGFSCIPILIHINGIQSIVEDKDYFNHLIDFTDFL